MWEVEYSDEFAAWWDTLSESKQIVIRGTIGLLQNEGPNLKFPYSSSVQGSKYSHMRELRIQIRGKPCRILYAFDPMRRAILLIGGFKSGNDRWYIKFIPIADNLYTHHINALKEEKVL